MDDFVANCFVCRAQLHNPLKHAAIARYDNYTERRVPLCNKCAHPIAFGATLVKRTSDSVVNVVRADPRDKPDWLLR